MSSIWTRWIAVCLFAGISAARPAVADQPSPKHLQDAQLLAHSVDAGHNAYAHKDCFIRWKGEDGADIYENRTDCSDFLNLLLEHSYQLSRGDLYRLTGHERPVASVWYETIHAEKGFSVVASVGQIQPGDVMAVQFPPGSESTGHIMLVAGTARHRDATVPLVDGTEQWELPVIDSSESGHGLGDTRHRPDGGFDTGVGEGILRLYSNADGSPAGYSWSVLGKSKFKSIAIDKFVIGRLQLQAIHADR